MCFRPIDNAQDARDYRVLTAIQLGRNLKREEALYVEDRRLEGAEPAEIAAELKLQGRQRSDH